MRVFCAAQVCGAFLWAEHFPRRPRTLTVMALLALAPGAALANSFAVTQGTWGTNTDVGSFAGPSTRQTSTLEQM